MKVEEIFLPICKAPLVLDNTTNACKCPVEGEVLSGDSCVVAVKSDICPTLMYKLVPGESCATNGTLTKFPGCCCDSIYYADNEVGACVYLENLDCNCTSWMITE